MNEKPHVNLVTMGHVDCGKSTLLGQFIYQCGGVDKRILEKYEQETAEMGRGSFKYAWIMDQLRPERERGITIDIGYWKLETSHYNLTLIDGPGHRDFTKNLSTGIQMADFGLLVVASPPGEFEASITPDGQARMHAQIALTLGIKQLIVIVNKMDDRGVNYSENRFNEIKTEITSILRRTGWKDAEKIPFIPVSAWLGQNLINKCALMPWYKGNTLLDEIDGLQPPVREVEKEFRMTISDVYKIGGIGTVVVGKVEAGKINTNQEIEITPMKPRQDPVKTEVKSIEAHHMMMETAKAGDFVGLCLKNVSTKEVHRGCVIGTTEFPPKVCTQFTARIIVNYHPSYIAAGYSPVMDVGTQHVDCKVVEILRRVDNITFQTVEEKPMKARRGDCVEVIMKPLKPVVIEKYDEFQKLGRFVLRDMRRIVGVGMVLDVEKM